jgi:O-antigen ligase
MHRSSGAVAQGRRAGTICLTLSLLVISIGFLSVTGDADRDATMQELLIARLARLGSVLVAFSIAAAGIGLVGWKSLFQPGRVRIFALYALACAFSALFSAEPWLTAYRTLEVLLCVLLAALVTREQTPLRSFKFALFLIGLLVGTIWIGALIAPGRALQPIPGRTPYLHHMLYGVLPYVNPNTVGSRGGVLAVSGFIFALTAATRRWRLFAWLLFFLGVATVIASYSRMAFGALGITLLLMSILLKRWQYAAVMLLVLGILALAPGAFSALRTHMAQGREATANVDTWSSGRWSLWHQCFEKVESGGLGPLFVGNGLGVGLRYDEDLLVGHAHNSYIELMVDVGLFGLLLWFGLVVSCLWTFLRYCRGSRKARDTWALPLGVLLFLIILSVGASAMVHFGADTLLLVTMAGAKKH